MPSIADSKRLVQEGLNTGLDHSAILASLREEIDSHNTARHSRRRKRSEHQDDVDETQQERRESALRFRFKHDKRRSLKERSRRKHRKHTSLETQEPSVATDEASDEVHPFPREPLSPTAEPSDDAFLSSLLDALADDEAASYWESVYSQPIHTYERPRVETENGKIEHMTDDEYAAWVKWKMWERKHPEEVYERDRMAEKRREEEELRRKRKEDFVRRRQRDAWSHGRQAEPQPDGAYVFDFSNTDSTLRRTEEVAVAQWQHAWVSYLQAWEKLKSLNTEEHKADISKILPWPVLPSKPPTRPHIEEFLQNMPRSDADTRRRLLKVERVRWHPDKIQQRFHGKVDDGTMKVVTGIFQIIDALWTAGAAKSG